MYSRLKRKTPLKRSNKPIARKTPLKKCTTPIKRTTSSEATVKKKLSKIKKEIRLEAIQDGTYYCQGCGGKNPDCSVIDVSHIMSVGQYKLLELVKENMQLLGRPCHNTWESGTLEEKMQLLCYESNMEFIRQHDILLYNRLSA